MECAGLFEINITHSMNNDFANELKSYQKLWRYVIIHAIFEAASVSKKKSAMIAKVKARDFLLGKSSNLEVICNYANLDPSYVRQKASMAIEKKSWWNNYNSLK